MEVETPFACMLTKQDDCSSANISMSESEAPKQPMTEEDLERLKRKREHARVRQQRCRARKRAAAVAKQQGEADEDEEQESFYGSGSAYSHGTYNTGACRPFYPRYPDLTAFSFASHENLSPSNIPKKLKSSAQFPSQQTLTQYHSFPFMMPPWYGASLSQAYDNSRYFGHPAQTWGPPPSLMPPPSTANSYHNEASSPDQSDAQSSPLSGSGFQSLRKTIVKPTPKSTVTNKTDEMTEGSASTKVTNASSYSMLSPIDYQLSGIAKTPFPYQGGLSVAPSASSVPNSVTYQMEGSVLDLSAASGSAIMSPLVVTERRNQNINGAISSLQVYSNNSPLLSSANSGQLSGLASAFPAATPIKTFRELGDTPVLPQSQEYPAAF